MNDPVVVLLLAFGLDLLIGDPAYPLHPIRLIGRVVQAVEKVLRKFCSNLSFASLLLPVCILLVSGLVYALLHLMFGTWSLLIDLYLVYSLLALGDLLKHARDVEFALKYRSLEDAREKVQWMVGRDTSELDASAVARAAIESVAENFVDGFLSPLFWFALGTLAFQSLEGGVLLLLSFKVVSTLDSMVGYQNEQYQVLGRISAKLDDVLNFIPARLSIPLITLAARLTSNNWKAAWTIGLRDRLKHASPNSAHAEAAMAGGLNLQLGGPSLYQNKAVEKPWLGSGTAKAAPEHIGRALKMIQVSGYAALVPVILLLI
jgi:adenosylcobinamide-phosphate synthase